MISPRRRLLLTVFICSLLSACASPKPLEMSGRMPAEAVARAKDGDHLALTELRNAAHGAGAAEYAIGLGMAEGWAGQKDLEQALVWWQRAAEHGNADAKNALAVAHAEGLNGPRDLTLARNLWQQAAEQGNANAQYNLASLLVATAQTAGDMAIAADWLRGAADGGDPDAQYFLGNLYYNGEGVSRQPQESLRLWRQAAEQGNVESEFSLAEAYLLGAVVPVNLAEAEKWMRRAARHGHPDAAQPASMLARGEVPQPEMVERRFGGPSKVGDINDRAESSAPKFKAPPAVHRDVAAAEPAPARAKVRSSARDKLVAQSKRMKDIGPRSARVNSRGGGGKAVATARSPKVATAVTARAKSSGSIRTVAAMPKAAARSSQPSSQGNTAALKKAPAPRQVAQVNPKPKPR